MSRLEQRGIPDPGVRPARAIAISLECLEGGRVRMFIDEVAAGPDGAPRCWRHDVFITASEWPGGLPQPTDQELEGLGRTVWGCLVTALR